MDGHCPLDIDCGLERGLQSPHWACQVPRLTVSSILQSPLHHRSTWTLTHSSPLFSSISWWKRMLVTVRISEEGQIWKFLAQPEQNIVQLKEDVYTPPWKIRTRTIISHSFPFQPKYAITCSLFRAFWRHQDFFMGNMKSTVYIEYKLGYVGRLGDKRSLTAGQIGRSISAV